MHQTHFFGGFCWPGEMRSGYLAAFLLITNMNGSTVGAAMHQNGLAAKLARPNILALQPYRCARDDYHEGILLDANENGYGSAVPEANMALERYPDPYQQPIKLKLCAFRGHDLVPANVFVGVGSDEAIDLLMRIFCAPGRDSILITPPTYGMYKVCAKVNDVGIVSVPLTPDFDLVVPEIIKAITPAVKLIFLCSPGNPTAKALPLPDIAAVAQQAPDSLVVVDEAYVDFSQQGTALSLLASYPNLVVLQTLSKAFGLAAIRCGFCLAAPDIIHLMNNVKAPYNVNELTSRKALAALRHTVTLQGTIATILHQRELVGQALLQLDFVTQVFPSDANFLLFRIVNVASAFDIYKAMADQGVVTRFRGAELHCDNCIRVTIGTPTENEAFLAQLQSVYATLATTTVKTVS